MDTDLLQPWLGLRPRSPLISILSYMISLRFYYSYYGSSTHVEDQELIETINLKENPQNISVFKFPLEIEQE